MRRRYCLRVFQWETHHRFTVVARWFSYLALALALQSNSLSQAYATDIALEMLQDVNSISSGAVASTLGQIGSTIIFSANDGLHGQAVWRTSPADGTNAVLLHSFSGQHGSSMKLGVSVGGLVFFVANPLPNPGPTGNVHEIWVTDGTSTNTRPFHVSTQGATKILGIVGQRLIYLQESTSGRLLWDKGGAMRSIPVDGSEPSSALLDYNQQPISAGEDAYLLPNGNGIIITREIYAGGESDSEIWRSDGTQAGTKLLRTAVATIFRHDANDVIHRGSPRAQTRSGVVLAGYRGGSTNFSLDIWHTDGTVPGTEMIFSDESFYNPSSILRSDGTKVFIITKTRDLQSSRIFVSEGTSETTHSVIDYINMDTEDFVFLSSRLAFGGRVNGQFGIWHTDGISIEPFASTRGLTSRVVGSTAQYLIYAIETASGSPGNESEETCLFRSTTTAGSGEQLACLPNVDGVIERLWTQDSSRIIARTRHFNEYDDGRSTLTSLPVVIDPNSNAANLLQGLNGVTQPALENYAPTPIEFQSRLHFIARNASGRMQAYETDGSRAASLLSRVHQLFATEPYSISSIVGGPDLIVWGAWFGGSGMLFGGDPSRPFAVQRRNWAAPQRLAHNLPEGARTYLQLSPTWGPDSFTVFNDDLYFLGSFSSSQSYCLFRRSLLNNQAAVEVYRGAPGMYLSQLHRVGGRLTFVESPESGLGVSRAYLFNPSSGLNEVLTEEPQSGPPNQRININNYANENFAVVYRTEASAGGPAEFKLIDGSSNRVYPGLLEAWGFNTTWRRVNEHILSLSGAGGFYDLNTLTGEWRRVGPPERNPTRGVAHGLMAIYPATELSGRTILKSYNSMTGESVTLHEFANGENVGAAYGCAKFAGRAACLGRAGYATANQVVLTDGTVAGTSVISVSPTLTGIYTNPSPLGENTFFFGNSAQSDAEPWVLRVVTSSSSTQSSAQQSSHSSFSSIPISSASSSSVSSASSSRSSAMTSSTSFSSSSSIFSSSFSSPNSSSSAASSSSSNGIDYTSDSCPPGEECFGEPLNRHACAEVNGFLEMVNIATIINQSAASLAVEASLLASDGREIAHVSRELAQNVKWDIIVNDMGLARDSYGLICVSTNAQRSGAWSGQVRLYKANFRSSNTGFGTGGFDFVLQLPFRNPRIGPSTGPINTFHLGMPHTDLVANWVALSDPEIGDGRGLVGELDFFNDSGELTSRVSVNVPDGGRLDYDGHSALAGPSNADAIGLVRFNPDDESQPYLFQINRLFYDCSTLPCANFRTGLTIPERPATSTEMLGGVTTRNGWIGVVEMNNFSTSSAMVQLEVRGSNGNTLGLLSQQIPALATRHSVLNRSGEQGFLAAEELGSLKVSPGQVPISAVTMNYKLSATGALVSAYAAPLRSVGEGLEVLQFNSFLNQTNDIQIVNGIGSDTAFHIDAYDYLGARVFSTDIVAAGNTTSLIRLNTPIDTYGTVLVLGAPRAFAAQSITSRADEYTLVSVGE